MAQRSVITTPQGENRLREVVRIESEPCEAHGPQAFAEFWRFLNMLGAHPSVIRESADCPESATVKHNGERWVLETVSYLDAAPGSAQTA